MTYIRNRTPLLRAHTMTSTIAVLCCILFMLLCTSPTSHFANGEVYTALADMEELLETEAVLIANLENYITAQENKLGYLKKKLEDYQREHADAAAEVTEYLSNPINAFLLTKRLTSDWKSVESVMSFDAGKDFQENITNYRNVLKFPSEEDLSGAAVALMRLQDTYNLDTSSIARGELNGVQYSTEMTANDCFELGRQSYMNRDYYHTTLWMREAIDRLINDANQTASSDSTPSTSKADILEYLAFSTYKQGNVINALTLTNELLELNPNHERAQGNKAYYEKELNSIKQDERKLKGDDGSDGLEAEDLMIELNKGREPRYETAERKMYERMCRGDNSLTPLQKSQLKCQYVTNKSAFLKIAPLKMEEAYLDPRIVIYHNVLSDDEIAVVKRLAKPRFQRATVQNHRTGKTETAHYRISKSAWLREDEHEYIKRIAKRVEDMTGLTATTAEELQVANYGIGGHYEPHFDFARRDEKNAFENLGTGNRIATVLFYMSDVEQGGATVFPSLHVALWPRKGTAAFWHNLHESGEGDYLTRHAACPVLTGSKWVSNKWLHERGQEFLRPCGLEPDHPPFE